MRKAAAATLIVVCLANCTASRGFDRGKLRASMSGQRYVVTDEDVSKVLKLKKQLHIPFRLAIYLAPPAALAGYYAAPQWRWSDRDRDQMQSFGDELKRYGLISSALMLHEGIVQGQDLKSIRLAAARAGAEAVLVVRGGVDNDHYNNWMGPLYIALVTALIVPGSELESLFMANAALWDVGNEYLYLAAESEGTSSQTRPAAYINERTATAEAKQLAIGGLLKELLARFSGLR